MINMSSIFSRNIKSKGQEEKKKNRNHLLKERKNLKARGGPKEYYMMGIVLSYRWPSHSVFLKMEFSLFATNMEEDWIGNIHC